MKKAKILTAAVACAALGLGLTSCGGKDDSKTIKFYTSMGNTLTPILQGAIDEFEAANEGWKVDVVNPGNYDAIKDKIKADLQVGAQPALAYCYADHVAEYLPTGQVLDIQSRFIDKDADFKDNQVKDFVPGYYEEGHKFGDESKLYTLPFQRSTEVIYYNADMLQKAGVDPATLNTWDGLWAACEKIKKAFPKVTPMGYDSESNWFIVGAEQNGIPYTSATGSAQEKYAFNNDKAKAFLKELNGYYQKDYFTTQTILGGYTSNSFVRGEIAMSIGSTGGANHQDPKGAFNYGVAAYPQENLEKPKSMSQGPSLVMFEQSSDEKEDKAWEFAKMILQPQFQADFSVTSGYLPVRTSTYELESYKAYLGEEGIIPATLKVAADNINSAFASPAFNGSNEARKQVGIALTEAVKVTGDIDAQIAKLLQEAYDQCAFFE